MCVYIYKHSITLLKWKSKEAMLFDIIFHFIMMYVRSLNYTSVAINSLCLNENKKRGRGVWYYISSYCKHSEGNCSSQGELTYVIKYAAVSFAELLNIVHLVLRNGPGLGGAVTRSPTSPDRLPNLHSTCDYFTVHRPRWKRRQQQVCRE